MANMWSKQRRSFYKRWVRIYGGLNCLYCNKECSREVPVNAHNRATIDHLIPSSINHMNKAENLVLACFQCNQEKSDTPFYEFLNVWR